MREIVCRDQYDLDKAIDEVAILVLTGRNSFEEAHFDIDGVKCPYIEIRGVSHPTIFTGHACAPVITIRENSYPYILIMGYSAPTIFTLDESTPEILSVDKSHPTIKVFRGSNPTIDRMNDSRPRIIRQ